MPLSLLEPDRKRVSGESISGERLGGVGRKIAEFEFHVCTSSPARSGQNEVGEGIDSGSRSSEGTSSGDG